MKEETIFRIASQTKAVVSVGVMILQEESRLLITDPVGKYLPEFLKTTVAVPTEDGKYEIMDARRPITIRDLLTHTSGISYGNGVAHDRWSEAGLQGWYFADRDEPIGVTVSRMATLPFDAQPGERWIYGYSIDILGALIERVSGLTLNDFLRTQILEPLGMRDTHFFLPPAKSDRLAVVYSAKEEGGIERAPHPGHMVGQGAYLEGPGQSFSGGADLLSTAGDYARFLQMLLNGGKLDGTRILTPKTVQLMTVSHLGALAFRDGAGFGLGFSVVQDLGARGVPGSVGEFGWGGAYHSRYWVDPQEQLVVVYLTQLIPATTWTTRTSSGPWSIRLSWTSPNFSHLLVTKRWKGRPDKARDRGPRRRTIRYVEEAGGTRLRVAQHRQDGSLRRCSRGGVRNAG